jgi:hypothetical protein
MNFITNNRMMSKGILYPKTAGRLRWKQLLTVVALLICGQLHAATVFTSSMTATPTNKTCYSGGYSVSYTATVPPPSGYTYPTNYNFNLSQTKFELRKASTGPTGTVLAFNSGGTTGTGTVSGSFDISAISGSLFTAASPREDVYTIYATIYVNDVPNGITVIVTTNVTFTVGYNGMWDNMIDMTSAGTSTVTRNTVTSGIAYGGAKSFNYLTGNTDGWMDIGAQFSATSTTRSIYIMLVDFNLSSVINPSGTTAYVEYRKGGTITSTSGEGIYFKSGTTTYKLAGAVLTDRLRLQRSSGDIKFYKSNSMNVLSWTLVSGPSLSSLNIPNELFVMGYAPLSGDGIANVLTSFPCAETTGSYAKLERNLTGVNYTATDKLYFSYDEEYAPTASTTLNYRILNAQHKTLQSSAVVTGSTQVTVNRIYGDNRFELPLASSISVDNTFILEVTNEKKEVFYLRFTRKK